MKGIRTTAAWLALATIASAESNPALSPPDGISHRGDKMVGDNLTDLKDVAALGMLYREAKGFEIRQEYFLRLLDHFWFSQQRFTGMKLAEIEQVFGPGKPDKYAGNQKPNVTCLEWSGGRDLIKVWFEGEKATGAAYIMGY